MTAKMTRGTTVLLLAILVLVPSTWAAGEEPAAGSAEEPSPAASAEVKPTPAALPAGWSTVAIVPWGTGAGKLAEKLQSKDEQQVYYGPTRFLVFPDGGFAVLDVLGDKIEEFDSAGKSARSLPLPASDQRNAETLTIDMAAVAPGEYCLLNLARRAVLHVKAGAPKPETFPIEGLTPDAMLNGLTSDGRGNLYILDSNDNSLFRMSTTGEAAPGFKHDAGQPLTVDPAGRFYAMSLAGKTDARHWDLVRLTPPSKLETLGRIETKLEANRVDPFGLDLEGNVYVHMCCGAIENPTTVEVVRYSPDGKETGRVACPADPIELKFAHGKAVAPDGTLYAVVVRSTGLELTKHAALP